MFKGFFKNLFRDPLRMLVTVAQAITIAVAFIALLPFNLPLMPMLVGAVLVASLAVGADIKWLQQAIAVGSFIAAVMLWGVDLSGLALAYDMPLLVVQALAWLATPAAFWWRIALLAFSAWTTLASLLASDTGSTYSEAMIQVVGDVAEGVGEVVGSVAGTVVGAISTGIGAAVAGVGTGIAQGLGFSSGTSLLLTVGIFWVGYKMLTKPAAPKSKITIDGAAGNNQTPAQPAGDPQFFNKEYANGTS